MLFQFSSVSQSCPTLCNPMDCSTSPSLSTTNSLSLLTRVHRVSDAIQSSHPPLLLPPSIFPSIRGFPNESVLRITWPKYWSFSFSISPSNEYPGLIPLGWTGWISLQSKGLSRVFSNTIVQIKGINFSALSLLHSPTLTSIHDHWKNHSLD